MVSLPRMESKLVTQWIVATVVLSIVSAIDGGFVARWCVLIPSRVLHGEFWRVVTWPLVEQGPLSLILAVVAVYKFGGELAQRWGDHRLQRFMTEVVIVASAATCLIALLAGQSYTLHRLGGWVLVDALVIGWARQFPQRTLTFNLGFFFSSVSLSGDRIVWLISAIAILGAVYFGPVYFAPEALACLAATLYPRTRMTR